MTSSGIPEWTTQGILPPIHPSSELRAPYIVLLDEVVLRFGTTPARQAITEGFLQYRTELHAAGLIEGFQWIDGSFLENIELLESRPPNDVDVITFYRLPNGVTQADLAQQAPGLFDRIQVHERLRVDAGVQCLDVPSERIVAQSMYWYSMWSHRRDRSWKGFLQVDLSPSEDDMARRTLRMLRGAGV